MKNAPKILKHKKPRIYRMIDDESYNYVMRLYAHVKRNKTKYTLNDLVLIKSFFANMIIKQREYVFDGEGKWATPFEYFDNRCHYLTFECHFHAIDQNGINDMLIAYFLDKQNINRAFNFDIKKDYGKLI